MFKSNLFQKSLSLIMVMALLLGIASPAAAATAGKLSQAAYTDYIALGDGATFGIGLEDPAKESYVVKVAEALAAAGKIEDAGDYKIKYNQKYRLEEIRYLLDSTYAGDGYTAQFGGISAERSEVSNWVANAQVVTINAGVHNFTTYIIEQMVCYLENDGAVKYSYSFDAFGNAEVQDAVESISDIVMDKLIASAGQYADTLEMIQYVAEISTYAVLSYITSFNAMVSSIYKLNPDVDLYIVGLYNPADGESLTYNGNKIPVGDFFGALIELANAYAETLAPNANKYTYVDPGDPELLIQQMGNTKLTEDERIPSGLILELMHLAGESAVNQVADLFAQYVEFLPDYDEDMTEAELDEYLQDYAYEFLEGLVSNDTEAEREQYILDELDALVSDKVYSTFVDQLAAYLGQFGNAEEVVDEARIAQLLEDLEAAANEAARAEVAGAFVDELIQDPDLLNQAAAQVIYEYIEAYGLSDYVTVDNVVELLEAMGAEGADREAVATAWVHDLAVAKITKFVQDIVGEGYTIEMADAMLTAMQNAADPTSVAKASLWNDAFADYLSEMIEAKFDEKGLELINFNSFDAFVNAIYVAGDNYEEVVRETILASGAAEVSEISLNIYTTEEIIALFSEMDSMRTDAAKKAYLETNLKNKFGGLYNVLGGVELLNKFWNAYTAYVAAANTTIDLIGQYLDGVQTAAEALTEYIDIQENIVEEILDIYAENFDSEEGKLDLSGFADFQALRNEAVNKILDGYVEYEDAIAEARSAAGSFEEYLDPVYEMLLDISEIHAVDLNLLMGLKDKATNESYIQDLGDRIMAGGSLARDELTAAYLALRYYIGDAMMILPSVDGHADIASNIIKSFTKTASVSTNSVRGTASTINYKLRDIYRLTREYLTLPTSGSGQVGTLINPENYVAIGDNLSTGDSYVKMLAEALAMEYNDINDTPDGFDQDVINNLSIDGMRTVELLALLSDDYYGDAYTEGRFGSDFIESKRAEFQAAIKDAELITLNIGINDLVTYPMNQALLAYNGEETYEMDWNRFFSTKRVNQFTKGKNAAMDLLLFIADNADSRVVDPITGKSAYDEAETALRTVSTAVEALVYSLLNYAVNLDASVEAIAEQNRTATIVLVGFYNPMEDTYVNIDREVSVGDNDVDLSKYTVNTSALTEKVLNQANRFLTNYVGYIADDITAADEYSRVVAVSILDTELQVSDTDASKDLSTLTDWRTVSVLGKEITIKIPEYLQETLVTGGEALQPNANGHKYIRDQILDALNFEIHADVVPQDNTKVYGEDDPDELIYYVDDMSSIYKLVVNLRRDAGDDVGTYPIYADVTYDGYFEVDVEVGTFTITARPITIDVKVLDGEITEVTVTEGSMAYGQSTKVLNLAVNAEGTEVTYDNANYDVTINATFETTEVMQEGTIVMNSLSLYLESEVHYNVKYTLTDFNMDQVVEIGVLRYLTDKGKETSFYDNADEIIVFDTENGERDGEKYVARTSGVPAKNLGDDTYFKAYVKLKDGTYRYSPRYVSSAVRYTDKVFENQPNNVGLQRLCIALLNYGSAAQVYFAEQGTYTYETLMNTTYMADQYQNMISDFNQNMIDERLPSNAGIYGEFAVDSGKISLGMCNLSLMGAISLNIHSYDYDPTGVEESGFVIWDHETFASGEMLTRENAMQIITSEVDGSIECSITGIAASGMCDTYVVAPYIVIDGTYYYRNISRISVDYYAQKVINGDHSQAMIDLAKCMVVYGEYAESYFR